MGFFSYLFIWRVHMKILRKLRVVSILVAFAILAGQFCTVNVNAAQGVEAAPIGTQLSGFRITDLDKPVPGKDPAFYYAL